MTAVAVGTWSSVGWSDPAPGNTGDVYALASRFESQGDELRALITELRQGLSGLESWQGVAADRFRTAHQHLSHGLDTFLVQYDRCADALRVYAGALANDQRDAAVLLPQVLAAFQAYRHPHVPPGTPPELAVVEWGKQRAEAWARIQFLSVRHGVIAGSHWASARRCDTALRDSDGSTAVGRLFGHVADVLETGTHRLGELGHDVNQWIHDNAETIAAVSDVLGNVGSVLGLIGVIPGLQGFAVAGAILSGAALAGHLIAKRGGAKVGWGEIVSDGAGLVGGLAIGKVAESSLKGARAAVEVADATPTVANVVKAEKAVNTAIAWKGVDVGNNVVDTAHGFSNDYDKYWRPRNATQALVDTTPGGAVGNAFWNAIDDGQKADHARVGAR